jgi:hypothetical protein
VIMPTKHLTPGQSLLGAAAQVLGLLDRPRTVNQLWEQARADESVANFDRFVLAVDLLFLVGAIELTDGRLRVDL